MTTGVIAAITFSPPRLSSSTRGRPPP